MSIARKKFYTFVNSALLTVSLISMQSICHADEYEKNGLPCVKEICIGDGVDALAQVKWVKVNVTPNSKSLFYGVYIRNTNEELQTYIGNTKNLTNYIGSDKFDARAISHLNEVTAVCKNSITLTGLVGTYKSKDGNLTEVEIELIPDQRNLDSLAQSWVVTGIKRAFTIKSSLQREEVRSELDNRYAFVKSRRYNSEGNSNPYVGDYSFNEYDDLRLTLVKDPNTRDRLSIHPGCPGATKVRLD